MVQKYQSPVRVYKYPFELVMAAYERRFPICPQMPIVLDCVVTEDETADSGASRKTTRRCKLAVEAPYLFKKLIGLDHVFFIQKNMLDMRARTLNIEATNETFASRIEIFERCRYYAHPDNAQWTCFDQTATLDIKNFFGFEHQMEKMGMKQYTQTTLKGKEIIEFFVQQLKAEGTTHVDRWIDANPSAGGCSHVEGVSGEGNSQQTGEASEGVSGPSPSHSPRDLDAVHLSPLSERKEGSGAAEDDSKGYQLDEEYIAKYLGELTPLQESKLLALEAKIKEHCAADGRKLPDHQTMLRFLRARDYSVDKGFAMLVESLQWRRENEIDRLLECYKRPSVLTKHFPGGWHHYDNDGRPLYVLRLGHMDVKGLLKTVGEEGLLRLTLYICEEGLRLMKESAKELEKPISNWCLLVDLEGLSMRHLWRPGVKALLRIIETVERNYPETMGRVLIVRAPRVFPILWTLIIYFIDENTRSKFLFYGGQDCMNAEMGLQRYIPPEIIPDFLGGPRQTLIHEGGLVPKNLYKTSCDWNHAEDGTVVAAAATPHVNQDMYKAVEVKQGQYFEILLRNNDLRSVLTWDFDVLNVDVKFSIYRTMGLSKEVVQRRMAETPGSRSGRTMSILEENKLIEDGVDFVREEPTITCRPKESVQGSHVMDTKGTYILQWHCPQSTVAVASTSEAGDGDGPGANDGGGEGGNAQLLYYYEVLSSESYRGSMTSLQSGFSAMSGASSCQSR